jgi:formiminoglutamate deiminase
MAGLAETRGPAHDDFWTWREVMYRFLDRLNPEDMEAIAALAYAEMLEGGFTRVGEFHYLHHDISGAPYSDIGEMAVRIVSAAAETGIGLTLLPVFYAHADFGGAPPVSGQRRFLTDVDSFANLLEASRSAISALPDPNLGVAPHSLRATTPAELAEIASLGSGGPIHIHAAEQRKEVEDCLAWKGVPPVEWLLDHAGVDRSWCIVHATHMSERETSRLAASEAVTALCPVTEANLGDGVFPAERYLDAGGRFGVGTDSNVFISAASELRMAEYAQRLSRRERNLWPRESGESTGRALFDGALLGGGQALGQAQSGIRLGESADFISLDANDPTLEERRGDAILDSWIFGGARIDCVWRRGEMMVKAGRHQRREEIARRYRRSVRRLRISG